MTDPQQYEQWKREQGLDRRASSNFPVLPTESKAAQIANNSAKLAEDERED